MLIKGTCDRKLRDLCSWTTQISPKQCWTSLNELLELVEIDDMTFTMSNSWSETLKIFLKKDSFKKSSIKFWPKILTLEKFIKKISHRCKIRIELCSQKSSKELEVHRCQNETTTNSENFTIMNKEMTND